MISLDQPLPVEMATVIPSFAKLIGAIWRRA